MCLTCIIFKCLFTTWFRSGVPLPCVHMFNKHTTCIAKLMVHLCEDIFLFTQQSTSHIDGIFVLNSSFCFQKLVHLLFKYSTHSCHLQSQLFGGFSFHIQSYKWSFTSCAKKYKEPLQRCLIQSCGLWLPFNCHIKIYRAVKWPDNDDGWPIAKELALANSSGNLSANKSSLVMAFHPLQY